MKENKCGFQYESIYQSKGFKCIAGVDEVGRGAWAGPVYTAAVVLAEPIDEVNDSKLLLPKKREELSKIIKKYATFWSITFSSIQEINQYGIQKATFLAFKRSIENIPTIDFVLIDGFEIPEFKIPQKSIVKGDTLSNSIAAASIIAKVERDLIMSNFDIEYPNYFFSQHKGYGTKLHQESLIKYGPCEIHRVDYKPIKNILLTKRS